MITTLRGVLHHVPWPALRGLPLRLVAWGRAGARNCSTVFDRLAGVDRNARAVPAPLSGGRVPYAGDRHVAVREPAHRDAAREPQMAGAGYWAAVAGGARAPGAHPDAVRAAGRLYDHNRGVALHPAHHTARLARVPLPPRDPRSEGCGVDLAVSAGPVHATPERA